MNTLFKEKPNKNIFFKNSNELLLIKQDSQSDDSDDSSSEDKKLIKKTKSYGDFSNYGGSRSSSANRRINTPLHGNIEDSLSLRSNEDSNIFLDFIKNRFTFRFNFVFFFPTERFKQFKAIFVRHSHYFSYLKHFILMLYCLGCIIILSMNDENEGTKYSQTVVSSPGISSLSCSNQHTSEKSSKFYRFKIKGPFVDVKEKNAYNDLSNGFIKIDITLKNSSNILDSWTLITLSPIKDTLNIYTENSVLKKDFKLSNAYKSDDLQFNVNTNNLDSIAINYSCDQLNSQFNNAILYSAILLIFIYTLIIFEVVHRSLAANLGAFGGIALLTLIENERPSINTIVTWVEWETILLIFGMMLIVALFCETGFFDLIAVRLFHYAGTRIWLMVGLLCFFSAFLSAFLDNVTTILLLTPITIRLCEVMNLDPTNIVIGEIIFSNIGGCATAIGDPPNVIITANSEINSKGIDFANFTLHMLIGSFFVYSISFLHYRLLYADPENFCKDIESEFDELKKEIVLWTRCYKNITPITKEEKIVKTLLKEKVSQLESLLSQHITKTKHDHTTSMKTKSKDMVQTYKINDITLLMKCSIVFAITLVLFFLHPFIDTFHLTIGWISILSASVLMVLSSNSHQHQNVANDDDNQTKTIHNSHLNGVGFEALMHKVEWSTLLFFSGLFIFMKTIEELGLLNYIGNEISSLIKSLDNQSDRLVIGLLLLTLLSALISSLIDNIPFTTAMIPIVLQLSEETNLPLKPLVYALAFGSCLGGNGSLIGASCNLVAAAILEQHGYKITFKKFFLTGFPLMLTSVLTALVYVCVTCIYLEWY